MTVRATPSTHALLASSPRRISAVGRVQKRQTLQVRSLWWWGRHGSWSSAHDESIDDRMHKHQKFMQYRYFKALRRRALWEREDSPSIPALRGSSRLFGRVRVCSPFSTTDQMRARLKDEQSGVPQNDETWQEFQQRQFESFKEAVDREIAKDPYRVVFGRRLRHPSSSSTLSWSTLSRIFDTTGAEEPSKSSHSHASQPKKIKIENLGRKQSCSTPQSNGSVPQHLTQQSAQTNPSERYMYDPISGRMIPKPATTSPSEAQPEKGFLQSLFSENGAEDNSSAIASNVESLPKDSQSKRFPNSRLSQLQNERAAVLGNSIDTTAEFGGKYEAKSETEEIAATKSLRPVTEHDDDIAPFTGTTYASRAASQNDEIASKSWLMREGFQEQPPTDQLACDSAERHRETVKLQSSLDRLQNRDNSVKRKIIAKLQPASERMGRSRSSDDQTFTPAPSDLTKSRGIYQAPKPLSDADDIPPDVREDLDLLRASDVRAATKLVRTTKREVEQEKRDNRAKLEADFESRQNEAIAASKEPDGSFSTLARHPSLTEDAVEMPHSMSRTSDQTSKDLSSSSGESDTTQQPEGDFSVKSRDLAREAEKEKANVDRQIVDLARSINQVYENGSEAVDDQPFLAQNVQSEKDGLASPSPASEPTSQDNATFNRENRTRSHSMGESGKSPSSTPFVILTYNKKTGEVDRTQVSSLMGQCPPLDDKINPMAVMRNLNYPAAFVPQFAELESAGYKLASGGGDILIFLKQDIEVAKQAVKNDSVPSSNITGLGINTVRNKIAAEEAQSQPAAQSPPLNLPHKAATVLDELPAGVPTSGPAGPPTSSTTSTDTTNNATLTIKSRKKDRKHTRVRRQEEVFSGTIRPNASTSASEQADDNTKQGRSSNSDGWGPRSSSFSSSESFMLRFVRSIRRIFLTTAALAGGAYIIGVVAEGMGAHAQVERGMNDTVKESGESSGDTAGPRKRIVMPLRTRPGIYSTESSRDE